MTYFADPVLYLLAKLSYSHIVQECTTEAKGDDGRMKRLIVLVLILLVLPFSVRADLQAHFLDVGQGDCTIILCDGEAMVIDGGPRSTSGFVYRYIRKTLKLKHVDYIISTHPHLDHVAGLSAVLNAVPVDLILTPVLEWDSEAFSDMKSYAQKQGTPIVVPEEGDTLQLGGATVTILHCWPEAINQGRTNDASIVVRIDYRETSFLITGDAEDWSEYMMIDSGMNLAADVLRIGHHGSRTSSTFEFLKAVEPQIAIISVGKDNGYGHPHTEVLEKLEKIGSRVLRTDENGTIILETNGEGLTVSAKNIF